MDQEIIDRIRQIKDAMRMPSDGKFADMIDLTRSNYSKMMSGGRKIGDGVVNKICQNTKASKKWLTKGEGEMFDQEPVIVDHRKGVTKRDTPTDMSLLIDLLVRQQRHIGELSDELERKNAIIDELQEKISQNERISQTHP